MNWIPVHIVLPDETHDVLIFSNKEIFIGYYTRVTKNMVVWVAYGYGYGFNTDNVTHWMELPESPE